jgi:hypothetical protein
VKRDLTLHRLGIDLQPSKLSDDSSCQTWATHTRYVKLDALERAGTNGHPTLRTLVFTAYGDHGIVAMKRISALHWPTADHVLCSWIEARPFLHGWLLELRASAEVAA